MAPLTMVSLLRCQDELQAEKATAVDDANVKRMRIEHRYNKPRLPMPTDDDRVTMLAEQVPLGVFLLSRPSPWGLLGAHSRYAFPLQVAVTRKELSELIGAREDFEEQSTKVSRATEKNGMLCCRACSALAWAVLFPLSFLTTLLAFQVIKAVENHINLDLTVEKRARKDLEARMLKYAEDLVIALRDDLEAEKKMRMEAQTVYHQTLEDIMEISKNIDLEAGARKQQEINIDKHLVDELGLLRDLCDQVAQKRGSLEFAFKEKLDAEFLALSLELERERRLRAKMEADHQAELDAEIELITNLINTNTKKAEEEETSLIVQVAEEADNLKQLLLEEHGNRDDSEKSMVSLMDEMYTKLHREVDEERQDRESTQERFIRMLEGLA